MARAASTVRGSLRLLVRRSISDPTELVYFLAHVPEHYVWSLTDLAPEPANPLDPAAVTRPAIAERRITPRPLHLYTSPGGESWHSKDVS